MRFWRRFMAWWRRHVWPDTPPYAMTREQIIADRVAKAKTIRHTGPRDETKEPE